MIDMTLLKAVLAVPTQTHREARMIIWLTQYFQKKGYDWEVDPRGNVYVTKGKLINGERYPCVAAHTDSVHVPQRVEIVERNGKIIALDEDKHQCGLGGDDKAGIFEALEVIEANTVMKGAFFVSEECGCEGSRECNEDWFVNVGYVMEFDSPCDDILTYTCQGVQLFPDEGEFIDIALPIFKQFGATNWQHHPYTDACVLKRKFDFPCLNLPAGYFRMHSPQEYVLPKAVENAVNMGNALVTGLGRRHYKYEASERERHNPALPVIHLKCHG